jgi:outer membrane lipoprotein carrier protein
MYIYDKPLQQVTEKKLNNSLGLSPALLLAGGTDVKKYYTIKVSPESGNLEWVNLQPKNINDNNGFKTIDIGFNKTSHLLSQMKFIDSFDNKSEISFTNLRTDIKAPASTFTFVPPKGVDIIKSDN